MEYLTIDNLNKLLSFRSLELNDGYKSVILRRGDLSLYLISWFPVPKLDFNKNSALCQVSSFHTQIFFSLNIYNW
jgi:hypothetical protein